MLFTGIKTPVGIKILGSDLSVIQELGLRIEQILRGVPGTRSAYAERVADGYFVDIRVDRGAIARYGLTVQDVEEVVQTAIGGNNIGHMIEGRERYPINVRYQHDFRDDVPALERVLVKTPDGSPGAAGAAGGDCAHDRTVDDPRRERPAGWVCVRRHGRAATSADM